MTEDQKKRLIAAASAIREMAYAPYSAFRVGAALLTDSGEIVTGVNVENASYGLTVCAERNAIGYMVSLGRSRISAVAVASDNGVTPCGACRQVLLEFAAEGGIPVILIDESDRSIRETTLDQLIPDAFNKSHLDKG